MGWEDVDLSLRLSFSYGIGLYTFTPIKENIYVTSYFLKCLAIVGAWDGRK